jgi:hypothetical protein
MSWKDMEMRAFQTKEKRLPTTRPSTKMSSLLKAPGARMEVSQYGGAESAAACSYVCDKVSMRRQEGISTWDNVPEASRRALRHE